MNKHKWHKEIKAWADGATIQHRSRMDGNWKDVKGTLTWDIGGYYRVKPPIEPEDGKWYLALNRNIESSTCVMRYDEQMERFTAHDKHWWDVQNVTILGLVEITLLEDL